MNYAIFNRHTGALLWAGEADSRRAALAELADEARLSEADMDAASDWADIRTVSNGLLPFLDNPGVRAGVLDTDAIMATLERLLVIDAADELQGAASAGALVFFYSAQNLAGTGYQLAWQPSIHRVAIQREDSNVVDIAHGDTLLRALVEHFAG